MKKRLPALVLMLVFFISTAFAASTYKQNIQVEYGINVQLNNRDISMTDVNGKTVQAFVYQGTTYVPIRAVSDAFGADVEYDGATNTACLFGDFPEICAVVYEMNDILQDYYILITSELAYIQNNSSGSLADIKTNLDNRVSNIFDVLEYLIADDSYNIHAAFIVDDMLNPFTQVMISMRDAASAYENYINNSSKQNWDAFFSANEIAIDNYYKTEILFDNFFHNYCLWRDLDF
ncbi:MAG: copper amine oxidase N-terminal domain-containing protein [Agathobaculum sp.]|uniref:copper amine oxidase N-terminal domain-containing protein n=1 Tax=Agathobaculum sp. TaxID=2048138 RepID=UPI0025BD5954|nr:copper amine oxidase N-terminal domain-containing protein [Agathobaculum sp.]MCI7125889.1 copper amine oxidase N-terminal domain-containing protein [Agathobaculum sp.]